MMLFSIMQISSIADVVTRLNQVIKQCETGKSRAGYFAALYKRMTMAVVEGIAGNRFEDGARMEKLDIVFAQRYFDAYDAYASGKTCTASWKNAFDACSNSQLIVLQQLLMGINTHINLDLAIAAATIAPGNRINALQNDFNRINIVISSLVDDVQESLAAVWLPMRFITRIANGKQEAVLNFSIDKARTASWSNAVLLASINDAQRNMYTGQMDATVKVLGDGILSPGGFTKYILNMIRKTEYEDIARTIRLIHTTVVE